ncbi:MAG TPA: FMN-binding negative transcriptional regulator [Frankiaceae bacterium]|nr:FMN-binding negative transcriptional regulator [Frankiaceae bacterium]
MLVHPWDAPLDDAEWRGWLARHDFGQLIAAGRGRDVPVVVPTHFRYDGATTVELHLARPNPVWPAMAENPTVLLTVVGDYVYVPSTWGAAAGTPPERGIATSYYATVQLTCTATVVDDADDITALLRRQLGAFQPEGGYAPVDAADVHYARLLPQIRGLRLDVTAVRGKFKYGGNKSAGHRAVIAGRLAERGGPLDAEARAHLLRRTDA